MLILFGIALAIGLLSVVIRRARDAQYRRRDLAERVLALERDPEEPRELAQALCDNVTDLLALFGLSPGIGEFPDAYAARLTAAPDTGHEGCGACRADSADSDRSWTRWQPKSSATV